MNTDLVIDKAWSNIGPGDFIRWATPRFVKYGRVERAKARSLRIMVAGTTDIVAIPDAKWYHAQFKLYGLAAEEHLCVIDYDEWLYGLPKPFESLPVDHVLSELAWISVKEAIELIPMDPKQLRRYIRKGTIPAHKDSNDQWRINREQLMSLAAKYGWV